MHEQYNNVYGTKKIGNNQSPYASDSADRFARKCEVCPKCNEAQSVERALECPSPKPTAYDHHEEDLTSQIQCVAKQYVISEAGKAPYKGNKDAVCTSASGKTYGGKKIDAFRLDADAYVNRGEFVLQYDVKDSSNNAAEKLIFAMVMVDTVAPVIVPTNNWGGTDITIESCMDTSNSGGVLASNRCSAKGFGGASANDDYDGATAVTYKYCTGSCAGVQEKDLASNADFQIDIKKIGTSKVQLFSRDFADIFGTNNENNEASKEITITVQDTQKPVQYLVAMDQETARSMTASCDTTKVLSGVTTLKACVVYTAQKYVPGLTTTMCAGCNDSQCFSATGNGQCRAVQGSQTETFECGHAATSAGAEIFDAEGNALKTGAYCIDSRDSKASDNGNSLRAVSSTVSGTKIGDKPAVGSHTITYNCVDKQFAANQNANNKAVAITRTVHVMDRTAPALYITVNGLRDAVADKGNSCLGETGDYCLHQGDSKACHDLTNADSGLAAIKDSDEVKCTDSDGYDAKSNINEKDVEEFEQDNTQDKDVFHSAGYTQDYEMVKSLTVNKKGYLCVDTCNASPTVTTTWYLCEADSAADDTFYDCCSKVMNNDASAKQKAAGFNTLTKGAWAVKYVCDDGSNDSDNTVKCRNVKNEDHAKPIITILQGQEKTYEASSTSNYVDAGATCFDEVDGNISENVEVSGDVVNLARVGVYNIYYDCKDSSGNEATKRNRRVTVQDTTCPKCSFVKTNGKDSREITLEASFPYTDPYKTDVICTDELNTKIADSKIAATTKDASGNVIDTTSVSIVETTGTYYTTYIAEDDIGNTNQVTKPGHGKAGAKECKFHNLGQTADYSFDADNLDLNYNADDYTRTIVVEDTLKPVIKLQYGDKFIKRSAADKLGRKAANDDARTAGLKIQKADENYPTPDDENTDVDTHTHLWQAPSLMSEESQESVNGWVLGAIASAVSGLALLGYSLRKQSQPVATSVPV